MAGGCSTSRIWVVIAVAFCITTIGLAGYVVWKEVGTKKSAEERIIERYPTLFRTTEQQLRLFNLTTSYTPVNNTVQGRTNCSVNCSSVTPGSFFAPQISGAVLRHACCQSQAFFRDETTMTTAMDVVKRIAQFGTRKQFFKFEECSHVTNYYYGRCKQNVEFVTAVTVNDDVDEDDDGRYQVDWIKVPGTCKCLNT